LREINLHLVTSSAGKLVFIHPTEAMVAQIKIAFLNGIFVSMPVTLWQIGKFFWPALYPKERWTLILFLPFFFVLFGIGLVFGYYVIGRQGYQFLLSFATETVSPMITLETYLSFVLSAMLISACIFISPLVVLLLAKIGLIKASFLWRKQKLIILGLLVLVAILTPTVDVVSMLLVFFPMLFLFEISILIAWRFEKNYDGF
jgi:sec-independent protein translocase protein TatC